MLQITLKDRVLSRKNTQMDHTLPVTKLKLEVFVRYWKPGISWRKRFADENLEAKVKAVDGWASEFHCEWRQKIHSTLL